ncbi:ParA family protein [Streptomyces atacamensis]|uniref:ParA family protein n=1 Tax=Streptomyces atacamensis TaxID=531966 RepID=UPI00399CF4DE
MAKPKIRERTLKRAHVNQKGGVGKTTWTLNVGAAAANLGARVLIRDMDPQGNATAALCPEPGEYSMTDVLTPDQETGEVVEGGLAGAIRRTGDQWPKTLYVVTADISLSNIETDNRTTGTPRERRLQVASEGACDGFDLVLTDCPPSVGLLTLNALTDSDEVEIVTVPEQWAVSGCHQAHRTIRLVQKYHNTNLEFGGVWINRYLMAGRHPRRESKAREEELRNAPHFKGRVNDPVVTEIEAIRNAAGVNLPLYAYGPEAEEAARIFRMIAERALND